MKLSIRSRCLLAVAIFVVATIYNFAVPITQIWHQILWFILWASFTFSEMLVFWGIHRQEFDNDVNFQVPTILLVLCTNLSTILYLTNACLLAGSHYFDSLACLQIMGALNIVWPPISNIQAIISALALLGLGYGMSSRGWVWFLPAIVAFAQVAYQLAYSFGLLTLPASFTYIQYYTTWPIFYLAVAWYYSKVAVTNEEQ